ncbi:hypothetical protein DXC97_21395 [Lachnospiraceae bacterium TF09-5]|nr:hypothetical protein DXC97_21395 [Lachnospiraceae bacterium TF09-5]
MCQKRIASRKNVCYTDELTGENNGCRALRVLYMSHGIRQSPVLKCPVYRMEIIGEIKPARQAVRRL